MWLNVVNVASVASVTSVTSMATVVACGECVGKFGEGDECVGVLRVWRV